jgi:hypothetical protein
MARQATMAEILEKAFLTENDLERLGLRSRKTSQNLRSRGLDPLPYVKVGKSVRYPAPSVWAYLRQNKVEPQGE